MKKPLSALLALSLAFSLTAPVSAAGDDTLDRYELAKLTVELASLTDQLPAAEAKPSVFTDVPEDCPCKAPANLLSELGLMKGDGSGAFRASQPVTQLEAAVVALRWAGLTDEQIGAWPGDCGALASSLSLIDGADAAVIRAADVERIFRDVKPLRDSLRAETPAPYFVDGVAQPIFPYSTIVREVVYVETGVDSDSDGKADLVQVLIQRPAATGQGMKAATIFEARPYSAGTTDAYDLDTWNAHVVDAKLTQAEESTKTVKADWAYAPDKAAAPAKRTVGADSVDVGDVWSYTENVDAYDYFLVRGYAYASSAGLGTLGSDGFETCASADETAAYADVVKWLSGDASVRAFTDRTCKTEVKADWSNGNIAMTGQSYAGSTAFAVASTGVEGLKTIVPRAGIASWYDYYRSQGTAAGGLYYPGDDCDILADYCMSRQFDEAGYPAVQAGYEAYLQQMIAGQDRLGGDYNQFWDERNYTNGAEDLKCSALIVHGLNDFNVRPKQFDLMYDAFQTAGQTAKLVLHQGAHSTPEQIEDLDWNAILGRWYAHYLYGVDNGAEREPTVRAQSNLDLSWSAYDAWDSAKDSVKLSAGQGEKTFTSDLSVTSFDTSLADVDEGFIEYASDMDYAWERDVIAGDKGASAVYTFPVEEAMHILGGAKVTVRAKTDRPTGILSAMLVEIAPDGMERVMLSPNSESVDTVVRQPGGVWYGAGLAAKDMTQYALTATDRKIVTRGWMDIQNRTSIYNVDKVEPGIYYDFVLELQPEDYTVEAGHQLALVIYSVDPEVTYWPADVTNFTVDGAGTFVEIPVA